MEYSIQEVAKAAGTTSRTLRHYDDIGLLLPSRIGDNGYRYYDNEALVRLQRILLLRQLGLGLEAIADVLKAQDADTSTDTSTGTSTEARILSDHLELLKDEQRRLTAQIGSVERTIAALTATKIEGRNLMSENIFDGFDHTQHKEEVEQRWGKDAYTKSNQWWTELREENQADWRNRMHQLNLDWIAAAKRNEDPTSPAAQQLAERHVEWLRAIPGTPAHEEGGNLAGYLLGLGEMYVADERFAANYGGITGAMFVRDVLQHYVESALR